MVAAGVELTEPPEAGVPLAVPSTRTKPASTSAWVTVYVAVQVVVAPGATAAAGQVTGSAGVPAAVRTAATATPDTATLPRLVTAKPKVTWSPAASARAGVALAARSSAGAALTPTVAEAVPETGPPPGAEPVTAAVLVMLPASRSAWVTA